MLPTKHRLNLRLLKKELMAGRRVASEDFTLFFRRRSPIAKVGIIVSKKVTGKAVDRNRIKRLVAAAFGDKVDKLEGEILVIVKKNIAKLKNAEVSQKLEQLLAKGR